MTWYADLEPCDYFGEPYDEAVPVGWLEATEPYTRGRSEQTLLAKLNAIRNDSFAPMIFMGPHFCSFCLANAEEVQAEDVAAGIDNLWIPGDGVVYVTPELVTHYMQAHEYLPPQSFLDAVRKCPTEPADYARALSRSAPVSMRRDLQAALDGWLERLPSRRAEEAERKKREFRWSWKDP